MHSYEINWTLSARQGIFVNACSVDEQSMAFGFHNVNKCQTMYWTDLVLCDRMQIKIAALLIQIYEELAQVSH